MPLPVAPVQLTATTFRPLTGTKLAVTPAGVGGVTFTTIVLLFAVLVADDPQVLVTRAQ
jgi:hypothetical protein